MTIRRMDHVGVVVSDGCRRPAEFRQLKPAVCVDSYRLCYVSGPEGLIVALAEQLS
jgi:hypothetical protein